MTRKNNPPSHPATHTHTQVGTLQSLVCARPQILLLSFLLMLFEDTPSQALMIDERERGDSSTIHVAPFAQYIGAE